MLDEIARIERENNAMEQALKSRALAAPCKDMPYATVAEQHLCRSVKETFAPRYELTKDGLVPARRAFEETRLRITRAQLELAKREWAAELYALDVDEEAMWEEFVASKTKSK